MRWKVLGAEIIGAALVAASAWGWFHRPLPVPAPAPTPEVTVPVTVPPPHSIQPPKEIVAPIPTPRPIIRKRIGHRTTKPVGGSVPGYIRGVQTDPRPMDIRPRRVPSHIRCSQIPRIAYQFDRSVIVQAMQARGLDADQQRQVLACLGK